MEFSEPILISVRNACMLLGIGRTKLFALLNEQALERKKIGRKTLITLQSVRTLADKGQNCLRIKIIVDRPTAKS
ncbi:hypothetical protein [Sphingomonas immobilis]|uniref:Helix-turn-helix domain-containing protein n=1 Tax=Sphingomonas immobilis TaxID=3063997 RepID=A0ABT9A3I1_9SPHN|nr:hypothetical protein [Sphingomonas sp. CA1-15]MDO7843770.1 hypothetical protein [Sphingomonas sp. CA1-15]